MVVVLKYKSQKAVVKRDSVAWSRFECFTMTSTHRNQIFDRLKLVLADGAKIGQHLVVGNNSIQKLLERDACSLIYICRDTPPGLHNFVVEAARIRKVPLLMIPKGSALLATALGMKRASCMALPTSEELTSSDTSPSLLSLLDGMRDLVTPPPTRTI
eukprot:gene5823-11746_t